MHPLSKHYFGPDGLPVAFGTDSGTLVGYITKQVSQTRFYVTDGTIQPIICMLAQTPDQVANLSSLASGLCTIVTTDINDHEDYICQISSTRCVTVSGVTTAWHRTNPAETIVQVISPSIGGNSYTSAVIASPGFFQTGSFGWTSGRTATSGASAIIIGASSDTDGNPWPCIWQLGDTTFPSPKKMLPCILGAEVNSCSSDANYIFGNNGDATPIYWHNVSSNYQAVHPPMPTGFAQGSLYCGSDDGTILYGYCNGASTNVYTINPAINGGAPTNIDVGSYSITGNFLYCSTNGLILYLTSDDDIALMWTPTGGISALPVLTNALTQTINGCSYDGSVAFGTVSTNSSQTVVTWQSGTVTDIGYPFDTTSASLIAGSSDGSSLFVTATGGTQSTNYFVYAVGSFEAINVPSASAALDNQTITMINAAADSSFILYTQNNNSNKTQMYLWGGDPSTPPTRLLGSFEIVSITASNVAATQPVIVGSAVTDEIGSLMAVYWNAGQITVLPGLAADASSNACAITSNLSMIFGNANDSLNNSNAIIWSGTNYATLSQLPGLVGGGSPPPVIAGASDDGSVIVGAAYDTNGQQHAVVWRNGQLTDFGWFSTQGGYAQSYGCSANGEYVVGYATSDSGFWHAFIWNATTGLVDIGALGNANVHSVAQHCSSDGSLVVGYANNQAVTWKLTPSLIYTVLPVPAGGGSGSANYCSDDGSVIVGYVTINGLDLAAAWVNGTYQYLDKPESNPNGNWSYAYGCNADGSLIVGQGNDANDNSVGLSWTT